MTEAARNRDALQKVAPDLEAVLASYEPQFQPDNLAGDGLTIHQTAGSSAGGSLSLQPGRYRFRRVSKGGDLHYGSNPPTEDRCQTAFSLTVGDDYRARLEPGDEPVALDGAIVLDQTDVDRETISALGARFALGKPLPQLPRRRRATRPLTLTNPALLDSIPLAAPPMTKADRRTRRSLYPLPDHLVASFDQRAAPLDRLVVDDDRFAVVAAAVDSRNLPFVVDLSTSVVLAGPRWFQLAVVRWLVVAASASTTPRDLRFDLGAARKELRELAELPHALPLHNESNPGLIVRVVEGGQAHADPAGGSIVLGQTSEAEELSGHGRFLLSSLGSTVEREILFEDFLLGRRVDRTAPIGLSASSTERMVGGVLAAIESSSWVGAYGEGLLQLSDETAPVPGPAGVDDEYCWVAESVPAFSPPLVVAAPAVAARRPALIAGTVGTLSAVAVAVGVIGLGLGSAEGREVAAGTLRSTSFETSSTTDAAIPATTVPSTSTPTSASGASATPVGQLAPATRPVTPTTKRSTTLRSTTLRSTTQRSTTQRSASNLTTATAAGNVTTTTSRPNPPTTGLTTTIPTVGEAGNGPVALSLADEVTFSDERPASGVKVNLFAADENGNRSSFLTSVTTGQDGIYTFDLATVDPKSAADACYVLVFVAPEASSFEQTGEFREALVCPADADSVLPEVRLVTTATEAVTSAIYADESFYLRGTVSDARAEAVARSRYPDAVGEVVVEYDHDADLAGTASASEPLYWKYSGSAFDFARAEPTAATEAFVAKVARLLAANPQAGVEVYTAADPSLDRSTPVSVLAARAAEVSDRLGRAGIGTDRVRTDTRSGLAEGRSSGGEAFNGQLEFVVNW